MHVIYDNFKYLKKQDGNLGGTDIDMIIHRVRIEQDITIYNLIE